MQFDINQRVKQLHPPIIHPLEDYQYEKSKKYPRKRRSIYPSFMPEIRIVRHDIRRKYGDMFVNVTNTCDSVLMTRFFGTFVRPDCIFDRVPPNSNIYKNIDEIYFSVNSTSNDGVQRFLHEYSISCKTIPDQVLRLQECQVRTRQGSAGSIIVLKTFVKCVQLLKPNSSQIQQRENKLLFDSSDGSNNDDDNNNKNSLKNSVLSTPLTSDTDSSDESSLSENIQLLSPPIVNNIPEEHNLSIAQVQVETIAAILIIMILDENHFIRKIHIEDKLISEKTLNNMKA